MIVGEKESGGGGEAESGEVTRTTGTASVLRNRRRFPPKNTCAHHPSKGCSHPVNRDGCGEWPADAPHGSNNACSRPAPPRPAPPLRIMFQANKNDKGARLSTRSSRKYENITHMNLISVRSQSSLAIERGAHEVGHLQYPSSCN